jgi:hypothetical protein
VLYLSKQAYILQGAHGDAVKPVGNGSGAVDAGYKKALALYHKGDTDGAEQAFRQYIADKINTHGIGGSKAVQVTADTLETLPNFGEYKYVTHKAGANVQREAGLRRSLRLGWTREKLVSYFGGGIWGHLYLTNGQNVVSFMELVTKTNGAMLANAVRPFYGVSIGGSSVSADVMTGGASSVFIRCSLGKPPKSNLVFDVSLFLRDDVFVLSSDYYGSVMKPRYLTPEAWKSIAGGTEAVVRNDIDLREYLYSASAGTQAAQVIKLVKERWGSDVRFANGRTPEQVFKGND